MIGLGPELPMDRHNGWNLPLHLPVLLPTDLGIQWSSAKRYIPSYNRKEQRTTNHLVEVYVRTFFMFFVSYWCLVSPPPRLERVSTKRFMVVSDFGFRVSLRHLIHI